MKKRKTLILMLSLVCLLVVGIGFAAITRDFTIKGNVTIGTSAFDVYVVDTQSVTSGDITYSVTAGKTTGDPAPTYNNQASISVTGMKAVGDTVTVPVTIKNDSKDYKASLSELTIGTYDTAALTVTASYADAAGDTVEIAKESSQIVNVVITVKQAQIESKSFEFTITFSAEAVPA